MRILSPRLFVALLLLGVPWSASAQVQSLWHIPENTTDVPNGISMRNPLSPGAGISTTLYQGVWLNGGVNNETGGLLYYRFGNSGAWQSTALGWDSNPGSNQIWKATLTTPAGGTEVQYYFKVTFSNQSTTFLYLSGKSLTESTAQGSPFSFTVAFPPPAMTVTTSTTGTLNADYTTSKLYVDEVAGDAVPITISFSPGPTNIAEVELWSDLNNRDRAGLDADGDGIPDGILPPSAPETKPAGYTSGPYPTNGYFQAIPITGSAGTYTLTTNATKTGAYRLTARYKTNGATNWSWYNGNSVRRDHCITVAPKLARNLRMYEINVLNVNATGSAFDQRSTFEGLTNNSNGRVNLDSLRGMGINALWFQPIHPNGIEGRETDLATGSAYDPGSPYAVKNFFEVNELMTTSYNGGNSTTANRAASLLAFSNFVTAADIKGINVILDAPFNHTAYDCEISSQGLPLFAEAGLNTSGWSATDKIKDRDARFYSTKGATGIVYSAPANSASDIAPAPDRNDFGKWADVIDVFFGRYATLVTGDPIADVSRATVANEGDWITISDLQGGAGSNGAVTRAVWKYFARYVPYWLEKTGLPAGSSKEDQAYKGIDGLRADFGQGMPPQFWEYVINVARTHKWNFIFMTESLDGGAVTYRSNRHFDLLNENIVFPWQSATNTSGHQAIFETRRTSYGQGLVLLNNTSHDEAGYSDPWQAFIRYAVGSTVDGAPMIMYGQEIGTSATLSFDNYELNFGKLIPHFKKWNSMQPQWNAWGSNSFGVKNLMPAYSGAGLAREFSPALRSSGRWFLNPTGSNDPDQRIFAVAKYEEANASPANKDVVLAFVNLDRSNVAANNFAIPSGLGSLLGIQSGRTYNVRNIAAYLGPNNEYPNRRNSYLWPTARTGADILTNGIYVSLAAVPTNDATWATTPFEAQYLKLYDVSTPTLSFSPPSTGTYETTLTLSSSNNASAAVTYSLVGGNTNKVSLAGTQLTFNSGTGSVTVRATITETANYLGTSADATITFAKATGGITLGNLTQTEGFVTAVTATTAPLGMGTVITYNGSASVPSLPNTYSVLASLSDENYQGSNSGTLTIVAAGPSFVSSFPGVTATSDSDHDGVSALLEYTLGGSTNSNDIGLLPVLTRSGSILRLTAVVRTNDPTLIIGAEAVTNLTGTWSSVNISTNTSNQTGVSAGFQRREYDFDAGTNSRAFLRLRVTQP